MDESYSCSLAGLVVMQAGVSAVSSRECSTRTASLGHTEDQASQMSGLPQQVQSLFLAGLLTSAPCARR